MRPGDPWLDSNARMCVAIEGKRLQRLCAAPDLIAAGVKSVAGLEYCASGANHLFPLPL